MSDYYILTDGRVVQRKDADDPEAPCLECMFYARGRLADVVHSPSCKASEHLNKWEFEEFRCGFTDAFVEVTDV